jgi:hypothetical protein
MNTRNIKNQIYHKDDAQSNCGKCEKKLEGFLKSQLEQ